MTKNTNSNKAFYMLMAIAGGNLAINIFYLIWSIVDDYSIYSDIFNIGAAIVIGLFILSGMTWIRYVFAGFCIYRLIFIVINIVNLILETSTQDMNWFLFILQIVLGAYFLISAILLMFNKDIKDYFAAEEITI